jgi:hypothetical protein
MRARANPLLGFGLFFCFSVAARMSQNLALISDPYITAKEIMSDALEPYDALAQDQTRRFS